MTTYLKGFATRHTPQSDPIPGTAQVPNSAGGHVWAVDDWTRLDRFLILGSEGGSYYASEQKLTADNAQTVLRCVQQDGPRTVKIIVDVSAAGRAPKSDPAIFALAIATAHGDTETKRLALNAIPDVCRIGTHLFHFAEYVEQFRGWGRGLRKAVGGWYLDKDVEALGYQAVKYRQRDGWTHRDLLRLSHPVPGRPEQDALLRWVVGKDVALEQLPASVRAYEAAQAALTLADTARLIREYGDKLPREALNPAHLTSATVWEALLEVGMPMTALIRNLANMTRCGLLTPTSHAVSSVVEQIADGERIRKARVHPIQVLSAMLTYAAGHSSRSDNTWAPVPRVVDALDAAFYASFGNVESTGKRWLLALDVSGSMDGGVIAGVPGLTPRVASSAMAMVTAATGDPYEVIAFTSLPGSGWGGPTAITPLPISDRQRLDDICNNTRRLPFGGTDCALPMLYALQEKREVDAFAVYTDSETWAGQIHPSQALVQYRQQTGIDAKLIVVGMVSNGFTIADPNDAGMLDVVGFDTATPQAMTGFVKGPGAA